MMLLDERFAPVGEFLVRQYERAFGYVLPGDYFEFLSHVKGWTLLLAAYIAVPGAEWPVSVTEFQVVPGKWEARIDEQYAVPDLLEWHRLSGQPKEFLVIAIGHEGQFVMDLRPETHGQIYFYDQYYGDDEKRFNEKPFLPREMFTDRGEDGDDVYRYVKVADNFTEFLGKLEFEEWDHNKQGNRPLTKEEKADIRPGIYAYF